MQPRKASDRPDLPLAYDYRFRYRPVATPPTTLLSTYPTTVIASHGNIREYGATSNNGVPGQWAELYSTAVAKDDHVSSAMSTSGRCHTYSGAALSS